MSRALSIPIEHVLILADGENLVFRFQEMLQQGRKVNSSVVHEPDLFVWYPPIDQMFTWKILRANYYMTVVGADNHIAELEKKLAAIPVHRTVGEAQLCPRVFKKDAKSRKTRKVDINITIDALRHSYRRHVDIVFLMSGDGDYLDLVEEVKRQGIQMFVGALSSGLDERLKRSVDRFIDLDQYFFYKSEA